MSKTNIACHIREACRGGEATPFTIMFTILSVLQLIQWKNAKNTFTSKFATNFTGEKRETDRQTDPHIEMHGHMYKDTGHKNAG